MKLKTIITIAIMLAMCGCMSIAQQGECYNATSTAGNNYICETCGTTYGSQWCIRCGSNSVDIQSSEYYITTNCG